MDIPQTGVSLPKYLQSRELSEEFKELISSLPTEKGWLDHRVYQYHGFWYSTRMLPAILTCQKHFQAQDSDIFLASAPKSATTWLKAMAFALLNRREFPDPAVHPLVTNNPHALVGFLDAEPRIDFEATDTSIAASPTPRLIATHLPLVSLPESVKKSACKLVYLCRNPKDIFVSFWHMANKMRTKEMGACPLEECFEQFCRGVNLYGPVWDHILGYWKQSLENPQKVLFLKFEEMKAHPEIHLRRIAEFIGCPITEEEESRGTVDDILNLCSFQTLSNLEVNKTGKLPTDHPNSVFFRRGEVGDWKNHLTPEMGRRLDQIAQEKWAGSGLSF